MSIGGAPRRNRLYRNPKKAKIKGVCAGIADYMGIDVLLVRGAVIIGAFMALPWVIIGYIVAAWALDDAPEDLFESDAEAEFWRNVRREPSGTAHDLRHKFRELERRLRGMEAHVTSSEFELNKKFRDLDR